MAYTRYFSYKLLVIIITLGTFAIAAQADGIKLQRSVAKPSTTNAKRDCERKGGNYVKDKKSKTGYSCKKRATMGGMIHKPASGSSRKKPSTRPSKPAVPKRFGVRTIKLSPTGIRRVKGARLVPGVIEASMEVNCKGGKTFTISTGENGGGCSASFGSDGVITGGECSGGGIPAEGGAATGGGASVDCTKNGGDGACTGSSGSGSCGETTPGG